METYIDLGAVVYEFQHSKGIFARRESTMEATQSMHADFYDLPDDTRYAAYADSSNKSKILVEEVTINDCKQSLQTISPIFSSEGTECVNITWEAKARARHRLESSLSGSRDSDGDGVSPVVDGSGPM